MNTLEEWVSAVSRELGLTDAVDRDVVLDLARDVAHGVARPAAPLTTFLVGLAAGRAGGGADEIRRTAGRVTALAAGWPGDAAAGSDTRADPDADRDAAADRDPAAT